MCIDCRREREEHASRAHVVPSEHARHLAWEERSHIRDDDDPHRSLVIFDGLCSTKSGCDRSRAHRLDILLYRDRNDVRLDVEDGHGSFIDCHVAVLFLLVLTDVVATTRPFCHYRSA